MYTNKWIGLITTSMEEEYRNVPTGTMRSEWTRISRTITTQLECISIGCFRILFDLAVIIVERTDMESRSVMFTDTMRRLGYIGWKDSISR